MSYLVGRGLLVPEGEGDSASPASGWDELLERISEREAEIEAGIDASTVRRLIESIASAARSTSDGLGPLPPDTIIGCFKKVCGYEPDDMGSVLLQRLPGLGAANTEDGSRVLIDSDFAEAARAGDIIRYVDAPFSYGLDSDDWQSSLRPLGAEVAAYIANAHGFSAGKLSSAAQDEPS